MSRRTVLVILVVTALAFVSSGTTTASQITRPPAGRPHRTHTALAGPPTVTITSPTDDAVLNTRDVEVTFQTTEHTVGPIGTPHIHFHLDGDAIPFMFFNGDDPTQFGQQAVLFDFDLTSRATWVNPNTLRFNALANGEHTLSVHLVDGEHNRLTNPEASLTLHFTVDVTPDDATPPDALVFVKEQRGENGMDRRVFDNNPDIIGDLYKLSPVTPAGAVTQLTDVAQDGGGVLGPEVSWDGQKILFSMRRHEEDTWHVYEMNVDGTGLRQITFDPPYQRVNDLDPVYLPDDTIMFASDRLKQRDEYNVTISTQLYVIDPDGSNLHLVEPNPSHDLNPQVIRDGRVTFDRWDHLAHRNKFTVWHMNQDGSSGFTFFGGASPRDDERLGNAQGIERRELVDGEVVGIFTNRDQLPGIMAVLDNRNGNLEDLPKPIEFGPEGLYRTPHPLTTYELVYSFASSTDPVQAQFGLYTLPWEAEEVLLDDKTESTAPGPGTNYAFRTYNVNLDTASRVYIEVSGNADSNGDGDDDDAWLIVDGIEHRPLERRLDGDLDEGLPRTYRADFDLEAGDHLIQVATDETPTIRRVRIVRAVRDATPSLLYDDPATSEVSPIPVRSRTRPPVYPSKVDRDLDYGTFVVRDVSLRGDFRQTNFDDPEGDPNYNFHLLLSEIQGLRVFQSVPRRGHNLDVLAGAHAFDPVRVLGVTEPNEFGTVVFQAPADQVTAWDLIGNDGAALVHERVWSLVQPGEVRACGGCHVPPQFPFVQREIGPFPPPTDLRTRGKIYTFVDDVLPILETECQACHTAPSPAGGLDLRGDRSTFDALEEHVDGRTPREYVDQGDSRHSFFFQLLAGDAKGHDDHQVRIDAINAGTDHTAMLTPDQLYIIATWVDTGTGFAFLPDGERDGGPSTVGLLPRPNGDDAPQNTGVALHFNAPIDRATLDENTFTLQKVGGSEVAGTWQWGNNRDVLFKPDAPLAAGDYEVTVSGAVLDVKADEIGDPLAGAFTAGFTVGSASDTTAPSVTERVPDGVPASVTGPIVLRFSEPLEPGSVSDQTLWVETDSGARVEGRVGVSADGREASFAPDLPFKAGATYTLHLAGDVRDLAGNALAGDVTHAFTTASTPAPQYHGLIADRTTGNAPEEVAVSSDGTRVLVANEGHDTVGLYDGATWNLLKTFGNVGDNPVDVAFTPNVKRAFVLSTNSDDVRVLRLSDGAVLATTGGLGNPQRLAVNNAGTRLYVTDNDDSPQLHELDVEPGSGTFGQVLRSLDLAHDPYDVAVSPDDQLLHLSGPHGITTVDVTLWAERHFIEIRYRTLAEIALSPDGRRAYVADRWGDRLHVVDLISGQHVIALPLEGYPESVAAGSDGKFVYVAERENRTIAVIDAGTLEVVRRLPSGVHETEGLALSPDAQLAYATEDGWPGRLRVFHLGDLTDTTAPNVSQVRPANDATGVSVYEPLLIDLSEALDRLTVTGGTVKLEQNGTLINGLLDVSDDNQRITLRAGSALQPGKTYTIRVTTGVQDLAGNPLTSEATFEFTTAAQPDPTPIGLWATPEAGDDPRGVAITPDGSQILVTDYWGNRLRIIDSATWTETVLDLDDRVGRLAVNPAGTRAYVLRPQADDVVVVNLTTPTPIDLEPASAELDGIPVGDVPVSALHHPTESRLYVVSRDSSEISVIDTQTNQETARWPANGAYPEDRNAHGLALGPDGSQLFVTSRERLSILDAGDGHLIQQFNGLPGWSYYGVAVTPDGNQVWLASADSHELVVIDLRIDQIVSRVPVGDYPTWLAMSPDGEWVYVGNQEAGTISVVRRRTATVLNTLNAQGHVYALALSADGQRLLATDDIRDVVLVFDQADPADEAGPSISQITPADATTDLSVVTPLIAELDEAVDRASVNGSTFRVTQSTTAATAGPAEAGVSPQAEIPVSGDYVFSADNRTITFVPDSPWQAGTTYTLRLESGLTDMAGNPLAAPQTSSFTIAETLDPPPVNLRTENYASSSPVALALSPDGSHLAVSNYYRESVSLLAPDTLAEQAEIPVGHLPYGLVFSADGSQLYVVNRDDATLSVIDVAAQQVTETISGVGIKPTRIALSPDGAKAYVAGYYNAGIDEVDLVSGQVTRLRSLELPGRPAFDAAGRLYAPERDRLWRRNTDGSWESLYVGSGYVDEVIFAADGRHAYLSMSWENRLQIVDLALWREVHTVSTGPDPGAMAQTLDGRLLMVANEEAGTVQILDGATHATLQTATIPNSYLQAVVWDEGRRRLYVGNTDAGQVQSFSVLYGNTSGASYADVDGDGIVDMADVQMVAGDWHSGDPTYDRTGDGVVNIADVMFVIANMSAP